MNEGAGTIAAVATFFWVLWLLVSESGPLHVWANENVGKAILLLFGAQIVAYFIGSQFPP